MNHKTATSFRFRSGVLSVFTAVTLGMFNSEISAGDYGYGKETVLDPAPIDTSYEFDLRLDGWIVQMNVGYTNSTFGIDQNVFLGIGDILGNVDWIVPMGAEIRHGNFGFIPDVVAMKLSGASGTPGPLFDRANVDLKMAVVNLPLYYRVVDREDLSFDVIGGARFLWVDLDVSLNGGPLGNRVGQVKAGTDAEVWNGIVGARIQQKLNDKMFYSIYGDVGTGGSDLTWQVWADLGYQIKEDTTMSVGYRYLTFNQKAGNSSVDLTASGPIIVVTKKF